MNTIEHPELGIISDQDTNMGEWATTPLHIGAFGYETTINVFTEQCPPSDTQLAAMVRIFHATPEFKTSVERYMCDAYNSDIRPTYAEQIGDARYRKVLTESDLPEIHDPHAIWSVISGMGTIFIDEECDLALSFNTTFDPGHEFVVRFQGGELYECMMEG
jgi:hypothetical protein